MRKPASDIRVTPAEARLKMKNAIAAATTAASADATMRRTSYHVGTDGCSASIPTKWVAHTPRASASAPVCAHRERRRPSLARTRCAISTATEAPTRATTMERITRVRLYESEIILRGHRGVAGCDHWSSEIPMLDASGELKQRQDANRSRHSALALDAIYRQI